MPFPIGHAAIGAATFVVAVNGSGFTGNDWRKIAILISVIANLPDIDFLLGLIISNNGSKFHGGITHTIYFSVLAGYFIAFLGKHIGFIPNIGFIPAFLVIFSHAVIDRVTIIFSVGNQKSLVDIFKPLVLPKLYTIDAYSGFWDIILKIIKQSLGDYKIIIGSLIIIFIILVFKRLSGG